jgi:hypothetical protein
MRNLLSYYRIFNILSLDIVAGSMLSALFFARIFDVVILPYGLIALGLTVWCIYTADHLRDAKNIKTKASTDRHRFHQKHFKTILIVLIVAVFINLVDIFFIRKQVLEWGLLLSISVCAYLIIQRYLRFLKEIFVAILYTCGVLLPSISVTSSQVSLHHLALIMQFALVALVNLLIFSWFDRVHDQKDKQTSFVMMLGEPITRSCIWTLLLLGLVLGILQFFINRYFFPSVILFSMNLILMIIFIFRNSLGKNDRYRMLGDAIFLIPILYLL